MTRRIVLLIAGILVSAMLPGLAIAAPANQATITVTSVATPTISVPEAASWTTVSLMLETPMSYTGGAYGLDFPPGSSSQLTEIRSSRNSLLGFVGWSATADPHVFTADQKITLYDPTNPNFAGTLNYGAYFQGKSDQLSIVLRSTYGMQGVTVTTPVECRPFGRFVNMSGSTDQDVVIPDEPFRWYVQWDGFGTDEVARFYRRVAGVWALDKTVAVVPVTLGEESAGAIDTTLPAGSWRVELYHAEDDTDFEYTSEPTYVEVLPDGSSMDISLSRSKVSYMSRKVTVAGRLYVNEKPAKYKTVTLYKDGARYRTLKTNKYGKVQSVVTAGYASNSWSWGYGGGPTVRSSTSATRHTSGKVVWSGSDTGNMLEYPHLRSGHRYQVRLTGDHPRVDLLSPSRHTAYHKYKTFSFTCRRTGTWLLYAANQDIYGGEEVAVAIW